MATKQTIERGDAKIKKAIDKIADLAAAYRVLGNDRLYDEMMHIGALVKEGRDEYLKKE